MKTDYSKSIELLNKAVNEELDAIHQYLYFHFHCDDQNFDLLAALFYCRNDARRATCRAYSISWW